MLHFHKDEFVIKNKNIRRDRRFLSDINSTLSKSTNDLTSQYREYLQSNDLKQICDSIQFFTQDIGLIDLEILNEIFNLDFEKKFNSFDYFEICDCINTLIKRISKCKTFLENTDLAMTVVNFLIEFSNSDEEQFAVTAYKSISNFTFANKDVAAFLTEDFLNECLNRFQNVIEEFKDLDDEDKDEINNKFFILESMMRVFLAMFFHPDLISSEFSNTVVKCFNTLSNVKVPPNKKFLLKVFIIDNAYWLALSAPNESIQNLLTPQFINDIIFFLELSVGKNTKEDQESESEIDSSLAQSIQDRVDTIKCSLFETIGKITERDDQFSLFFLQPPIDILNRVNNLFNWKDETKYSFLKILNNFTACNELAPSLSMIESPEITEFIKSIFSDCSFNAQKEAYLVLINMIISKNSTLIEYVLTNFSEIFKKLIDFLSSDDLYFNTVSLYSIYICLKYLEAQSEDMKNQFAEPFKHYEWCELFEKFSLNSDEKLSKLAHLLIEHVVSEN